MRARLLGATLLAGLAACAKTAPPAAPAARAVRCVPARAMTVAETIRLTGTISALPDRDAQVAPQVQGRLVEVPVREGDVVKAGQLVARVDQAPLRDEARAARATLARADAEARNAAATEARLQRVYERGIAARQEVDDAAARAEAARATRDEIEANVRRAERQLGRADVVSPLAGAVVKVFRRPGELVDGTPATPVVEIADPSRLELVADAPASELVRARLGQPATVTVGALPGASWSGTVTTVSPAVDRTTGLGVVRVRLDLNGGVRPPIGLLGDARVEIGPPHPSVGVPATAVRTGKGAELQVVLCGGDGVAHVKALPRGATAEGLVEAPGLTVGQEVVAEPLGLADGDPIERGK